MIKRFVPMLLAFAFLTTATGAGTADALKAEAQRVTIVRDDWGIAHVHGITDADAVFGMAYAQAEDDFNRIEINYLTNLGRLAEAQGPAALYQDLRQRLFIDPADLQAKYRNSPAWLRALMNAWAGGLNFYLATHPNVHPRVLTHFEPWMSLCFSEGSIGGDIEGVSLDDLRAFYGGSRVAMRKHVDRDAPIPDPQGSNGIAIAPANTRDHHALLLINPHTSFYFRSELQMSSDAGLDAYGAVTWGQFFIYQGFNAHSGWMHTSTGSNNVTQFAETIVRRDGRVFYQYGTEERPVTVSTVTLRYRIAGDTFGTKSFTVYRTHHGPVVAQQSGKWIAEALMYRPVEALMQSFLRTKALDYAAFRRVSELEANSSNDTIFADSKGDIAYMHPEFIPRRNDRFDYTKPVDGANPATDWQGVHSLDEEPHILNPNTGWVFNTNDWPYSNAGPDSPKRSEFPRYMDTAGENARGVHAAMLLTGRHDFTLEGLRALAYDPNLPFFAPLISSLKIAYEALSSSDPLKAKLAAPNATLQAWDRRWSATSVPTSLAVFWAEALARVAGDVDQAKLLATTPAQKLQCLAGAIDRLTADFGTWRTPWGEINRFQRLSDAIHARFDDAQPSIPVPFVSADWGSLAAFRAAPDPNTKRRYGTYGNSFVAVVEFGKRVRAIAVTAGGESDHVASPHFDDQAIRYSTGALRPVYFYPDELASHTVRTYHPGQ
ncbi:MAG: penicillin acylase family protein [Candidatus Eremiobacteraeota bacterium]|nr:penicillin acylase family protein [Candidatus Eremiobacteraeota bacterium]